MNMDLNFPPLDSIQGRIIHGLYYRLKSLDFNYTQIDFFSANGSYLQNISHEIGACKDAEILFTAHGSSCFILISFSCSGAMNQTHPNHRSKDDIFHGDH